MVMALGSRFLNLIPSILETRLKSMLVDVMGEDGTTRVLSSSWASMSIARLMDCSKWEGPTNLVYKLGCELLALDKVKLG